MLNTVLIAKNIRLTFKLTAKEIHVSSDGEIIIIAKQFGPNAPIPTLTVNYLEALCSKFYYGGVAHQHAIADILLLNGYLHTSDYGDFYASLHNNLTEQRVTIISSELFQ